MKVPFKVDLSDKIVAITGAGGVICSEFARALAECGAKVALLDVNFDAAKKVADEIGENAFAVRCNCLDKDEIKKAKEEAGSIILNAKSSASDKVGAATRTVTSETLLYDMLKKVFFRL